ncbi:hypothetical protein BH23ACT3_BH23ACT3_11590 [soil metagenome]
MMRARVMVAAAMVPVRGVALGRGRDRVGRVMVRWVMVGQVTGRLVVLVIVGLMGSRLGIMSGRVWGS